MGQENGPGIGARLFVGLVGSTVVVAPPLGQRLVSSFGAPPAEAVAFDVGTAVTIIGAWVLSVFLTAYMKEDHIMKCVLTSLGIPGLVVSLTIGFQVIQ